MADDKVRSEPRGRAKGTPANGPGGGAYANFGLVGGLVARGARVEQPLEGLGLGKRLHFYKEAGCL